MRLASFTDYSLRVLIYLALRPGVNSTVSEISSKYGVSNNHLVKVVHNLSKLGLISSYKGKGGGIRLELDPSTINIGKVIKILEQDSVLIECLGTKDDCRLSPGCKLKAILIEAQLNFYKTLESYNLKDMLSDGSSMKRSLGIE